MRLRISRFWKETLLLCFFSNAIKNHCIGENADISTTGISKTQHKTFWRNITTGKKSIRFECLKFTNQYWMIRWRKMSLWTRHINNHQRDSPVESFCCVQTHTSLPGPGQLLALSLQDVTETSLLTVLHDDEELRSGSYRQSQGHITSLSLERWIVPDTLMILVLQFTHPPPGHRCQTFAGCWVTQTASWFQFPFWKQTESPCTQMMCLHSQ